MTSRYTFTTGKYTRLILLALLCITSFFGYSQTINGVFAFPNPGARGIIYNGIMPKNELYTPIHDTTFTPIQIGAITKRPQDTAAHNNIFYTYTGVKWDVFTSGPQIPYTYTNSFFDDGVSGLNATAEAQMSGGVIYNLLDSYTGEHAPFKVVTGKTDADIDNVLLRKKNGVYYERVTDGTINIKWFGATGDGTTNDGNIIRFAIKCIRKIGGGTIFIPKGTYIVNRNPTTPFEIFSLSSNMRIIGEGANKTKLKLDPTDVFNFRRMFIVRDSIDENNIEIGNLDIDMSNTFTDYHPPFTTAVLSTDAARGRTPYPYNFGNDAQANAIFLYSSSHTIKNIYIHDITLHDVTGDGIGISKNVQNVFVERTLHWNILRQGIAVGGAGGVKNIYLDHIMDSTNSPNFHKGGSSIHYEPAVPINNVNLSNSTVTSISCSGIASGSIINVVTTDTTDFSVINNSSNITISNCRFGNKLQIAPNGDNVLIQGNQFFRGLRITAVGVGSLRRYRNLKVENNILRNWGAPALDIASQSNVSVIGNNIFAFSSGALKMQNMVDAVVQDNRIRVADTTGNYIAATMYFLSPNYNQGILTFSGNTVTSSYAGISIANGAVMMGDNFVNSPIPFVVTGVYTKYLPKLNSGGRQTANMPDGQTPTYWTWKLGDEYSLGGYTDGSTHKYVCSQAGGLFEEVWNSTHTYYSNAFVKGSDGYVYRALQPNGQLQDPVTDTTTTVGAITAIGHKVAGSGYTPVSGSPTTYTNVPVTGGTGTGATVSVVVRADTVFSVSLNRQGGGYTYGDTLSVDSMDIGETGAGFYFTVTGVSKYWTQVATTIAAFRPVGLVGMDWTGSGSPEGVVAAAKGSIYRDLSSGNVYNKTSVVGLSTGWGLIVSGTVTTSSLSTTRWTLQDNGATTLEFINNTTTIAQLLRHGTFGGRFYVSQFSSGTTAAAAPAFGFLGENNTGMYLNGTGVLGLTATGTSVGLFNSTGLSLDGTAASISSLRLKASTTSIASLFIPTSGAALPTSPTNGQIASDGTNFWIRSNGFWRRFDLTSADDLAEGATNKYYTDTKARAAITLTTTGSGAATYLSGVLNIPTPSTGSSVDSAEQVYTSGVTGTITWVGTTAPSGTETHSYQWTKVGKAVFLSIVMKYSVAGVGCTAVTLSLPADCPTPKQPSGFTTANNYLRAGTGFLSSGATGTRITGNAALKNNAGNTGYEIQLTATTNSSTVAYISITYFVP